MAAVSLPDFYSFFAGIFKPLQKKLHQRNHKGKKRIFKTVFVLMGILFSCEKEKNEYQSTGVITGPDLGQCICCGGYFIEIVDSIYNFDSILVSAGIDLSSETFPVAVKLYWTYDKKCGNIQYISITRIEKK